MKIYSDISLIDASSSISSDQNIYVLVRGNDGTVRQAPLTVNSVPMSANGNIAANLTAVITGLSSSLSSSFPFIAPSFTPRPPVSGTLFVVSGETGGNVGKNGEAYIFVTSSTQAGQWQQIFGFNFVAADARYVRLASTSSQSISSSLDITGSIYWNSGSGAVFPGTGVTANVVVLGDDNKLYITGAYGVGGGGGGGSNVRAGSINPSLFGGTPVTYSVSISSSMGDSNYGVSVMSGDARAWTIESKTTSSFIINSNSSVPLTTSASWIASPTNNPS